MASRWRLPAEWETQETVWFVWPRDPQTWPGDHLEAARAAYRAAIDAVAQTQQVDLVVHPDLEVPAGLSERVRVHRVEHQDSWIRDYGPLTVVDGDGGRRHLKFRFDAWGGKYESLLMDDGTTGRLQESGAFHDGIDPVELVLEGGAVETDGRGTFLATRSVAAGRGQSEAEHEAILRDHLGAKRVLWLDGEVPGDDTDGHIDTLARFAPDGSVVAVAQVADQLDLFGFQVRRLPDAREMATDDGDPLPASYANYLITNELVLVPTFGGLRDAHAIETIGAAYPGRRTVPIDHRDLIWGFGGIHCLTMQVARQGSPTDRPGPV